MIRRLFAVVLSALALSTLSVPALAVDVNKASQAELESIRGVGPAMSGRILEARKAGPFKDWADVVERVPGIGPGNAARLSQGGLTVAGAAYAGAPAAAPEKSAKAGKPTVEKTSERTGDKSAAPKS